MMGNHRRHSRVERVQTLSDYHIIDDVLVDTIDAGRAAFQNNS
jgi:hypothetical protein